MDRFILLLLAGILAGFALLSSAVQTSFLASITPVTNVIGVLAIVVFSLYLIFKAVMAILGK
ncbi:hypothetical protein EKG37_04035 [Robertmurraya yapensis]|uniref:Uncharacterized protein n=2 Tax=Bacillaceae TaxID=186817 RepID=A0A431WK13_9BACI|nr:hypothetical protein [Bacillus yapensis]RTR35810.1 hypothetical protein EKG37_04035 [Bacillus yapensis]TKS98612.1 hypothetical protein FAR12_04035 [Bacillus yapensis]